MWGLGLGVFYNNPLDTFQGSARHDLSLTNGETGTWTDFVQDFWASAWSAVGKGISPSILSSPRMKSGVFPATEQQSEALASREGAGPFPAEQGCRQLHVMEQKSGLIANSCLLQTPTPAFPKAEVTVFPV